MFQTQEVKVKKSLPSVRQLSTGDGRSKWHEIVTVVRCQQSLITFKRLAPSRLTQIVARSVERSELGVEATNERFGTLSLGLRPTRCSKELIASERRCKRWKELLSRCLQIIFHIQSDVFRFSVHTIIMTKWLFTNFFVNFFILFDLILLFKSKFTVEKEKVI